MVFSYRLFKRDFERPNYMFLFVFVEELWLLFSVQPFYARKQTNGWEQTKAGSAKQGSWPSVDLASYSSPFLPRACIGSRFHSRLSLSACLHAFCLLTTTSGQHDFWRLLRFPRDYYKDNVYVWCKHSDRPFLEFGASKSGLRRS